MHGSAFVSFKAALRAYLHNVDFVVALVRRLLDRIGLWSLRRAQSKRMEPGERLLAWDAEREDDGRLWLVSTHALYIEDKASPRNRAKGAIRGRRISWSDVEAVDESVSDSLVTRIVTTRGAGGQSREVGCFPLGGDRFSFELKARVP